MNKNFIKILKEILVKKNRNKFLNKLQNFNDALRITRNNNI